MPTAAARPTSVRARARTGHGSAETGFALPADPRQSASTRQQGRLGLDDTIGRWLVGLPAAWGSVTVRQMLHHGGGLPDYTRSAGDDAVVGWANSFAVTVACCR